jgi:D-alanine-D-alanine ligase
MKATIAILYAESRYTPWKENIDFDTVRSFVEALESEYDTLVVHMTHPSEELADLLKSADYVVNLCYGFGNYNQAEVAAWLDFNEINHLSSCGDAQLLAQDKKAVEELLLEKGVRTPISLLSTTQISEGSFIQKPRFGGCHRGIEIMDAQEARARLGRGVDSDTLLQPYLIGREFSVGVIPKIDGSGYEVLPPVEIVPFPPRDVFIAGSAFGSTQREFHPELSAEMKRELQAAAVISHNTFGLNYMSRVDIREYQGHMYILDINTMPNMHPRKSLIPAILQENQIELTELLRRFIAINNQMRFANNKVEGLTPIEVPSNLD